MNKSEAHTYHWPEDLLAYDGGRRVVGLRERPALAHFELDVVRHALDVLANQAFTLPAELDGQLARCEKGKMCALKNRPSRSGYMK